MKPHTLYVILTWWEGDGKKRRGGERERGGEGERDELLCFFSFWYRWEVKDSEKVSVFISDFTSPNLNPLTGDLKNLMSSIHD